MYMPWVNFFSSKSALVQESTGPEYRNGGNKICLTQN